MNEWMMNSLDAMHSLLVIAAAAAAAADRCCNYDTTSTVLYFT
jgi:hypothetical protein